MIKPNMRLKEQVLRTGTKQFWLAERAGLQPVRLSQIVNGHVRPRPHEQKAIARALRRPAGELFPKDEND